MTVTKPNLQPRFSGMSDHTPPHHRSPPNASTAGLHFQPTTSSAPAHRESKKRARTSVSLHMLLDVIRRGVIFRVASDVLRVCPLIHADVVDHHYTRELHRAQVNCLPVRCSQKKGELYMNRDWKRRQKQYALEIPRFRMRA